MSTPSHRSGERHQGARTERRAPVSEARITQSLLDHVADIATACQAAAVFIYADALGGRRCDLRSRFAGKVFYVTARPEDQEAEAFGGGRVLRVPDVPLTRATQVKMAAFLALSRGLVEPGDTVVFLSGASAEGPLDTLMVLQLGREFEMLSATADGERDADLPQIRPEVVERVVDIASELGSEGREGKPVGTMFVIGPPEQIMPLTRQLVLNPFRGYPESARNILDPALTETVKELASIDGAFIIRGDGVIESCGTYLKVASQEEYELPQGLGARHHAAAAITAVTDSIAVTVSESTGTVSIFRAGRLVTEIERPRASVRLHGLARGVPEGRRRGGARSVAPAAPRTKSNLSDEDTIP